MRGILYRCPDSFNCDVLYYNDAQTNWHVIYLRGDAAYSELLKSKDSPGREFPQCQCVAGMLWELLEALDDLVEAKELAEAKKGSKSNAADRKTA